MNIVPFPLPGLNNIPEMARRFADNLEGGDYGAVNSVIVVVEGDHGITSLGWGAADDPLRNIGLLHAAASMHLDCLEPDE